MPGRLLGRERELAKLAELLQAASSGGGAFAWLEGEAGIGKTRVLDSTAQIARERGFTVLSAAAQELEAHRPFAVVADCLRVDLRELTRAEELLAFIEAEAEAETARSPVLFVLDDLQWAGPSSLAFLGRLALELPALPALVLAAARPLPRRPELERLAAAIGARGGVQVVLGPLEAAVCEAIAEEIIGGEPGPELSARLGSCGGNPLFVSELLGALAAENTMQTRPDGSVEVGAAGSPRSLSLTVLGRLSFLPAEVTELLALASVLGSSFSASDLSLLTGRPTAQLWGPLWIGYHPRQGRASTIGVYGLKLPTP